MATFQINGQGRIFTFCRFESGNPEIDRSPTVWHSWLCLWDGFPSKFRTI